jgi:tRNA threonylcarbamoyladenosine biosynthesis protein TsaE
MNIIKKISNSLEDTKKIANEFAAKLKIGDIVIFNGDLGVGKTEFIKSICQFLNVEQAITSPSFTIINQYESFYFNRPANILHIDLYRIKSKMELIELGFQEIIFDKNSLKFIEWAENSHEMINFFNYKITINPHPESETRRTILIEEN